LGGFLMVDLMVDLWWIRGETVVMGVVGSVRERASIWAITG
jgi:hypothetical protein